MLRGIVFIYGFVLLPVVLAKGPELPDIRKIRIPRAMLATITVIPTRSSDHLSCCWLGISPHSNSQRNVTG